MQQNSKVLLILSFCLITTAVLAAGRCVPCKLNHYCVDGLRYQCPANTPVTQGMGAGALSECLTCTQRNGNSANPIYDDLVGDCVSCYEYDSSTPVWDGSACVACPVGQKYDAVTASCFSNKATCQSIITINGKNICLVEAAKSNSTGVATDTTYSYVNIEDETDEFIARYNLGTKYVPEEADLSYEEACGNLPQDYWAGAMKYCQDKGLRLLTADEIDGICADVTNKLFGCGSGAPQMYPIEDLDLTHSEECSITGRYFWINSSTSSTALRMDVRAGGWMGYASLRRNGNYNVAVCVTDETMDTYPTE